MTTNETISLTPETLDRIAERVPVPRYDRTAVTPGIVHFGPGNFHRAHQAVYLDRLMNEGRANDWGIVGVGTRPGDKAAVEALRPQGWMTTVVEQSAETSAPHVTGPMIDMIGPGETERVIETLADPRIRIVSLTITEGGYYVDAETGGFDTRHPEVVADLAGDAPTVFGLILSGLERRRAAGTPPFTVMSCDNLPHNGHVAKGAVVGLARLKDAELADWVEANVAFPNGMVDRITPATSDRERRLLRESHGLEDNWPVFAEDYLQWVLEDSFPLGRPALEAVGVEFVEDVSAHEAMKIRILNGGHAVIAYPAGLLDVEFVHEAMEHPLVSAFLDKVEHEEIIPHVGEVPGTDLQVYYARVRERFANPKIGDTVRRLCLDGSNRQPKFIVPTLRDRLAAGADVEGLALECALWCRYCYGTTESGAAIATNDPAWDRLTERAKAARENPAIWLDQPDVYGTLARDDAFAARFEKALLALWKDGTAAVLTAYLGSR